MVFTPESEYAKEMRRHEAYPTQYGPAGRPYQFQEFPKQMSRAEHVPGKGIVITDTQRAETDVQEANLRYRGFHFGQDTAIAAIERQQTEYGKLAAERNFEIARGRISEKAAAEVQAAEADHGSTHMPGMPAGKVRRKPGPKPKAQPTA